MIFFNWGMGTSSIMMAVINSACIVIITIYTIIDTSEFRFAREGIAFIIIVATIRGICDDTSFRYITMGFMTIIGRSTRIRNISMDTSRIRATRILSASIIIFTVNISIFARAIFITVRVT
jgi:hypothetical protein